MAISAGPVFKLNPSISMFVVLDDEKEIESAWNGLIDGGEALIECDTYAWAQKYGWLKDKYGVSWQIVPTRMGEMMRSGNLKAIVRITRAFLKMKKFDIATLEKVYKGE